MSRARVLSICLSRSIEFPVGCAVLPIWRRRVRLTFIKLTEIVRLVNPDKFCWVYARKSGLITAKNLHLQTLFLLPPT